MAPTICMRAGRVEGGEAMRGAVLTLGHAVCDIWAAEVGSMRWGRMSYLFRTKERKIKWLWCRHRLLAGPPTVLLHACSIATSCQPAPGHAAYAPNPGKHLLCPTT